MPKPVYTVTYKDVPGFPGYRVGDDGTVWSCRNSGRDASDWRKLKPADNGHGYLRLSLRVNGRYVTAYVHRLVLLAFVGPCPEGMEALHDPDPDTINCKLSNLRWGTPKDNAADKICHGRQPRGEGHYLSKFTEDDVKQIRRLFRDGATIAEIAKIHRRATGGAISAIVAGRSWKHVTA